MSNGPSSAVLAERLEAARAQIETLQDSLAKTQERLEAQGQTTGKTKERMRVFELWMRVALAVAAIAGISGVAVFVKAWSLATEVAGLDRKTARLREDIDSRLGETVAVAKNEIAKYARETAPELLGFNPNWTGIRLREGWQVEDGQEPQCCIDPLGFVHLRGRIRRVSDTARQEFCQLDEPFRPGYPARMAAAFVGGGKLLLAIRDDGETGWGPGDQAPPTIIGLDGVNFRPLR